MKFTTPHDARFKMFVSGVFITLMTHFLCTEGRAQQLQNASRGFGLWSMRDAVVQLGFNAIDDDNSRLKRMLDFANWSIPVAPSRFAMSKKLYDNYHIEIATGAARLKPIPDDSRYVTPMLYISLDFNFRYYLNIIGASTKGSPAASFIGRANLWDDMAIDIYPAAGFGVQYLSQVGAQSMPTFNLGGGLDWWIKKNVFAINIQSMARFALHLLPPVSSGNLLHYTAGLCWKYNPKVFADLFSMKPRSKYKRSRTRSSSK